MHPRHGGVELHITFADVAAVFDGFDAFFEVVRLHGAGC